MAQFPGSLASKGFLRCIFWWTGKATFRGFLWPDAMIQKTTWSATLPGASKPQKAKSRRCLKKSLGILKDTFFNRNLIATPKLLGSGFLIWISMMIGCFDPELWLEHEKRMLHSCWLLHMRFDWFDLVNLRGRKGPCNTNGGATGRCKWHAHEKLMLRLNCFCCKSWMSWVWALNLPILLIQVW